MAKTIEQLLGLQKEQKGANISALNEAAVRAQNRYGSQAGASGLNPKGSTYQRGLGDLLSGQQRSLGNALRQSDMDSQQALLGQERFDTNIDQRNIDRSQRQLENTQQNQRWREQFEEKRRESKPEWYDYLLGGASGFANAKGVPGIKKLVGL